MVTALTMSPLSVPWPAARLVKSAKVTCAKPLSSTIAKYPTALVPPPLASEVGSALAIPMIRRLPVTSLMKATPSRSKRALFTLIGETTEALALPVASLASLLIPVRVNHKNSTSRKPNCLKSLFTLSRFF